MYRKAWNAGLPGSQRSISVADFKRETDGELVFLARVNKTIAGYVSVWQADWFVHHLYVDPKVHGVGVGTALVTHVLGLASPQPISLKCQVQNLGAMAFYRALEFVQSDEVGCDQFGDWVRLVKSNT